jgi:hypothetical protein
MSFYGSVPTSELIQNVPGGTSPCAHWLRDMVPVPNGQKAFFQLVIIYIREKSNMKTLCVSLPI